MKATRISIGPLKPPREKLGGAAISGAQSVGTVPEQLRQDRMDIQNLQDQIRAIQRILERQVLPEVALPTSATGLSGGDVWCDTSAGNVLKVV
jgi:hypothetical protein